MGTSDSSRPEPESDPTPVLTEKVVFIHVPENRLFMCGTEPPSVPAMLEALKLFIFEASSAVFQLEIERTSSGGSSGLEEAS